MAIFKSTVRTRVYDTRVVFWTGFYTTRYMRKVIDFAHDSAVRNALGGPYSKGTLALSIKKRGPYTLGLISRGSIYTRLSYARAVEQGTGLRAGKSAYPIFPKAAKGVYRFGSRRRPQLKFVWRGRIVYTPHVPMSRGTVGRSHPGQSGKHYMRDAVLQTAVRFQMVVTFDIV